MLERQEDFQTFVLELGGELISSYVEYDDSFCCRLQLSGAALKDIVLNYQFVFDVHEYDAYNYILQASGEEQDIELETNAPHQNKHKICLIDSGIQEGHRLLTDAIDTQSSKSYIPNDASVMDGVANGGHGTKVAGAILFGNSVPKNGVHNFDFWIQNARVLNNNCVLPQTLFPPELMENIVKDFKETQIFNLSVTSYRSCKTAHMSEWATTIDKLMYEQGKLFIIAAGNINGSTFNLTNPSIRQHLQQGRNYPDYLYENSSRIANPAQSCFALTVGSVCKDSFEGIDTKSFALDKGPSSFSRTGPGLWNMIKPDVVEYGGDYIREKIANPSLTTIPEMSVEVVRTTLQNGPAIGHDIGTSFSAPKVTHIIGKLLNEIPNASSNLIRSLIALSARLPEDKFRNPNFSDIRSYGYGLTDLDRATKNSHQRITLTAEGEIYPKSAQAYTIKVPKEIRAAGNEFDILLEVSLAFTAQPRRTRRTTRSYLSTWIDWQCSKLGESYDRFQKRIIKELERQDDVQEENLDGGNIIQWRIRENAAWGSVKDLKRQDSSLQKDWAILKAYNLPEEFSIAVVGHKGWEKDLENKIPFAISVSFEILETEIDLDIYSLIRIENDIEIEIEQKVEL